MSSNPTHETSHAALILFLFVLVALVMTPAFLMLWGHFEPLQVLRRGDAGVFRTAVSHGDVSNVVTSKGVLTVRGGFSALDGQSLFVRDTNKYGLELCPAGAPDHCTAVSGTWVGPMQPVLHVRHWYVWNLSGIRESLPAMLMMGIITALAAALVASVEAVDNDGAGEHDRADDTPTP